ncbi:Ras guanine nucleotide exchange factor [Acrasis kona]|uniref:Ras guanine nucleotide exchange factor n=1 Tax=Acrasis kona TaxID=1008807 RepID=A0AAW2Z5D5_9EUKA
MQVKVQRIHKESTEAISERDRVVVTNPNSKYPQPRQQHASFIYNGKLHIFGGQVLIEATDASAYFKFDHYWIYNEENWVHRLFEGKCPPPRQNWAYAVNDKHLVIFGGEPSEEGEPELNDTWVLELSTMKWREVKPTSAIPRPRSFHSMAMHQGKAILFGGMFSIEGARVFDNTDYFDDLWQFDISTDTWSKIKEKNTQLKPLKRGDHTIEVYNDTLYVYGGHCQYTTPLFMHSFDFKTHNWCRHDNAMPSAQLSHVKVGSCVCGHFIVMYGGTGIIEDDSSINLIFIFNCKTAKFIRLNEYKRIGEFPCRNYSSLSYNKVDQLIYMFGGESIDYQKMDLYTSKRNEVGDLYCIDLRDFLNKCNVCGKVAEKRCSGCLDAAYCCREHQVQDWTNHKIQCKNNKVNKT